MLRFASLICLLISSNVFAETLEIFCYPGVSAAISDYDKLKVNLEKANSTSGGITWTGKGKLDYGDDLALLECNGSSPETMACNGSWSIQDSDPAQVEIRIENGKMKAKVRVPTKFRENGEHVEFSCHKKLN